MDDPDGEGRLVLASASPRRQELIRLLGWPVSVQPADIDETPPTGLSPVATAEALALAKARVVAGEHPGALVIGADTIVVLDGDQLGKPVDDDDALAMLRRLRGRVHTVVTGLALVRGERWLVDHVSAAVTMRAADDAELRAYIQTGEPRDKAGAYGYQGLGGRLVEAVAGCRLTVVGLPIGRLAARLGELGCPLPADVAAACAARTGGVLAADCCGRWCQQSATATR